MNTEIVRLIRQAATSKLAPDALTDLRIALRSEAERMVSNPRDDKLMLTVDQCEVLAFTVCFDHAFKSIPGVSLTPKGVNAFVGRDTANDQAALAKLGLVEGFHLH